MAPLAVGDFLLVNHEGNKTDKKEGRETDWERRGEGRFSDFLKCSDEIEALSSHEDTMKSPQLVGLPNSSVYKRKSHLRPGRRKKKRRERESFDFWVHFWSRASFTTVCPQLVATVRQPSEESCRSLRFRCRYQQLFSKRLHSRFITTSV